MASSCAQAYSRTAPRAPKEREILFVALANVPNCCWAYGITPQFHRGSIRRRIESAHSPAQGSAWLRQLTSFSSAHNSWAARLFDSIDLRVCAKIPPLPIPAAILLLRTDL